MEIRPIKKLLIANRGEIAIRILRTCRELGIQTVSVHSTADEDSLHVKLADESVCIGPGKTTLSYLNINAIISAAEITQADAIHPGYGLLSENEDFAKACAEWNILFIGPQWSCLEQMGDKINSKIIAEKAGVPILKSIEVSKENTSSLKEKVLKMGLPVLIKASAGGGGRGMTRIDDIDDLAPAITRLGQEALAAFGDGTLFIEKFITSPRHIEVQIWADKHGNILHLGERDCTIQRRFQKLVEESPSPVLSDKLRKEICKKAVMLAKEVGYDSVGTVEFLYDQESKQYYFMEMNTRIQVEHPVTEMRTGMDLVAEQIRSAQGYCISLKQKDIVFVGHSIECRLNAEDPITSVPAPGRVEYYYRPAGPGVRVDDFIYSGYSVPPFYDSMVAKVIVCASDRESAVARMKRALDEMVIGGIKTNIDLHKKILSHDDFVRNNYSTDFLAKKMQ